MPRQKSQHVDDPRAVGKRLKAAREAAGLSQRQLSFSGCSPAYISRIESGDRIPSLQLLRELGRRLRVSEDFLATGADESGRSGTLVEAELAGRLGDAATARALFQEALESSADAGERADALEGLGRLALHADDPHAALKAFEQALAARERDGLTSPSLAQSLGRAQAALGDLDPALETYELGLAEAERKDDLLEVMRLAALLAEALADSGDLDRAEEAAERALEAEHEALDPLARARLLWSRPGAEASTSSAHRALALLELAEDADALGLAHRVTAVAALERGEPKVGLRRLEAAWPLVERSGSPLERAQHLLARARAEAQLGSAEEAESLVRKTVEGLKETTSQDAGRAYSLAADVYQELGRPDRAQELYEQAAECLEQSMPTRYLAEVYAKLASLHEAEGRGDRAFEYEARARHAGQGAPRIHA